MAIKNRINKEFVFVNQGIIYEISKYNDADGCGVCVGYDYNDEMQDYEVKSDTELATIYPFIKLTYKYTVIEDDQQVEKTSDMYYWLQDFIQDGDKYDGSKFVCTAGLHGDDSATFLERYLNNVTNSAVKLIKQGYVPSQLQSAFPKFLSETNYKDTYESYEAQVTSVSLSPAEQILSDDNISKLYEEAANVSATEAANRMLKLNGKKVDTLTITTKNL